MGGRTAGAEREEWRTWKCPEPPPAPLTRRTHKADLLGHFDLTDDTAADIVREAGGVTDTKGIRTCGRETGKRSDCLPSRKAAPPQAKGKPTRDLAQASGAISPPLVPRGHQKPAPFCPTSSSEPKRTRVPDPKSTLGDSPFSLSQSAQTRRDPLSCCSRTRDLRPLASLPGTCPPGISSDRRQHLSPMPTSCAGGL